MSKTIPIWACVINRALADVRKNLDEASKHLESEQYALEFEENGARRHPLDWDCELHLPLWVSETEKNNIEGLLDSMVEDLKACGANLEPLARALRKPLRTLWVSQKTVIWINEVVDIGTLDFTPIFLVSASQPVSCTQRRSDAEFSWSYIPGAADDEESWARGLTPTLFWKHVYDLVNDGPADCNRKVTDLVERERVYRALRGQDAPHVKVKSLGKLADPVDRRGDARSACNTFLSGSSHLDLGYVDAKKLDDSLCSEGGCHRTLKEREINALQDDLCEDMGAKRMDPFKGLPTDMAPGFHWIGSTGLAVGDSSCCQVEYLLEVVDCVLNVSSSACSTSSTWKNSYLQLPVVGSKFDRHSLQNHLPDAVKFASEKLVNGLSLLICCSDGEDISVCVCLAILLTCFDSNGRTGSGRARLAATTTRLVSVVALLWAVGWVGTASGVRNLDMDMESELVETETGWQFGDDDIEPFDNATAPAPPPAAKVSGSVIPLINGDFELTNVTGNATVLADSTSTAIINWLPGGAGVQVLFGISYNMPPKTPKSLYCIHLNNPASSGNGTQGSLSTTLAAAAATGKTYTVQYDTARMPDGPINLWSALKVSAVEGGTVNSWVVRNPVYNATDAAAHITWQKQSFVYTGTGAQTVIKFESMSEKYGPIIDNVQILSGKHELAAAPLGKIAGVCQLSVPLLTLLVLQAFQPQLRLQL